MPDVSVLLPAFDAEATLPSALRSVLRSRGVDLECIVVDDGSRDATPTIAAAFAAQDARVRVVSVPHEGLVSALTRGVAQCRAPVIARMDADDVMHGDRLRLQASALRDDPTLSGVGCHVRLFPRTPLADGLRAYEAWLNAIETPDDVARERFIECPLAHPTLALRRDVLASAGYRDVGWPEDYDLVLRLLAGGHRLGVVPQRLLAWRDGPLRRSRTHSDYAQDRFVACKAAYLVTGPLADADRYVLWGHGGTGRALRRALLAHGRRVSHVVEVDPRKIGQRIDGAPVIAPEMLSEVDARPLIVSVAGVGPRSEIRAALSALQLVEQRDFWCAA
jgi:glycosyltransferase involved in cell wall biosynthesis